MNKVLQKTRAQWKSSTMRWKNVLCSPLSVTCLCILLKLLPYLLCVCVPKGRWTRAGPGSSLFYLHPPFLHTRPTSALQSLKRNWHHCYCRTWCKMLWDLTLHAFPELNTASGKKWMLVNQYVASINIFWFGVSCIFSYKQYSSMTVVQNDSMMLCTQKYCSLRMAFKTSDSVGRFDNSTRNVLHFPR